MIVLDIALFATLDATWARSLKDYVDAANYHLANFDMRLECHPALSNGPLLLPPFGPVHDRSPDWGWAPLPGDLRSAAHIALPVGRGIPVIYCKFHRSDAGLTVYQEDTDANRGVHWLNYILVNADAFNSDRGVLLHELIHASNYEGDIDWVMNRKIHDSDQGSVMRRNPVQGLPIAMYERHAAKLRIAYFARSV